MRNDVTMLDTHALREGMDLLTASLGVTLPEVTKKRHIARLERESGAAVDQVSASQRIVTSLECRSLQYPETSILHAGTGK